MSINQYIDNVVETSDVEKVNELLKNNGVIINTYVVRIADDTVYENLWYSIGHVNTDREFTEREHEFL